jgi:gliding motility-associated-like protein
MPRYIFFFLFFLTGISLFSQPYYTISRARAIGSGCYQINPDTQNTWGAIWSYSKINLTQSFDKTFLVNLGSKDAGADGISFTLQNSSAGNTAVGFIPSFLAYDNISPSLNIEIDTYNNSGNGYPDIAADHIAINRNGSVYNVLSSAVTASSSGRNIEDGQCHRFRVTWNPSSFAINVYFDDTLRINKAFDLVDSIFGGVTQVWWGFTGASGAFSNTQSICEGKFADAGPDQFKCPADTVQLNAAPANSYLWIPATGLSCSTCKSPLAFPSSTTNYILKATSSLGCISQDTVRVTVYGGPTTNAGPDITLCQGDSIRLNITGATIINFNTSKFLSDSSVSNPWCKPDTSITYIIKGSNNTGCVKYDTLNVFVTSAPHANAGRDTFVCIGSGIRLQAAGGASFQWSPATGLSATNIPDPFANPSAPITYKVVVSNGSCKDSDSVFVDVKPSATTNAGSDLTICQGDSVKLNASGAVSYAWLNKLYLSDTSIHDPWARPLFTTSFIVRGRSAFGCTLDDTVTVNVLPKVKVSLNKDTGFCRGGSVMLQASLTGTGFISWFPNYKISNTSLPNPVVNPNVDTTYYAVVTNGTCSDTAKVRISVWEFPAVNAGTDITICEGDSVQLNGSSNISGKILWQPSAGLSSDTILNPWAKPLVSTQYILQVTSPHNCISYDTVSVNITARVPVYAGVDDTICYGNSATLNATTFAPQVEWNTGDTVRTINVKPVQSTVYWVRSVNLGCYGPADSVTVIVDTTLHALFTPDPDNGNVPLTVSFSNNSRGAKIHLWDFGDGTNSTSFNPQHNYTKEGNYTALLTVTNSRGCTDTVSYLIIVKNNFKILIPNVFTANGDGLNDEYEIQATGVKTYALQIFNRWGQLVFFSDDPSKHWNGIIDNKPAPEGEYYYQLVVRSLLDEEFHYKGVLTLLR